MTAQTRVVGGCVAIVMGVLLFGTALAQPISSIVQDDGDHFGGDEDVIKMPGVGRNARPVDFLSIYWNAALNPQVQRVDTLTGQGAHLWILDIHHNPS